MHSKSHGMEYSTDRLDELADDLRAQYSVGVDVLPLDLSDAGSRERLAERLRTEPIAGLCNSAGFGTSGVFQTLPIERESEEVVLNSLALMELTHAALPGMVERGAGAVLNIASIAGFQPMPYMAVYSATKAFVQTFSEAVHEELNGTGVSVTVLCPGPVPTEWGEIANAERFSIPLMQVSSGDVAEAAIGGMLAGKRSVVPGIVPKAISVGGTPTASTGTGTFTISGGSATIPNTLKVWNAAGNGLMLSGGTLNVGVLDLSGNTSLFNWTGGTLNFLNGATVGYDFETSTNGWTRKQLT